MRKLLILMSATLPVAAAAMEDTGPEVERAAIALYVEEREPVGADTSFPADVEELACFSKIGGIEGESHVYHVWVHGSKEVARIQLAVRGPSWRTWSTKRILPSWTGSWRVEIRDAGDNLLETLRFTIRTEEEESPEGAGA